MSERLEWTVTGHDEDGEWIVDQTWGERADAQKWADRHGGEVHSRTVSEWGAA